MYLTLLSRADVSKILPMTAIDYIVVAVLAQYLLGEPVTPGRWAGIGLIVVGVSLRVAHLSPRIAALTAAALAVVAAAPFFLLGLGAAPFDDPGEGMHAEIARELLRSGPGLPLTLNGVALSGQAPAAVRAAGRRLFRRGDA